MIKIIYVGKDDTYFEGLKSRFLKVQGEEFEFKKIWRDEEERFQLIAREIVEELPNIAFLDYSASPQKMMTVGRSLPRLFKRGPSLIGLWDYQARPEHLKESLTLGIPFFHFKSPEFSDIVQQSLFLYKGGAFPEGEFAKADIMKKTQVLEARSIFRIGYMTDKYVHVEHDFLPPDQETFRLNHFFKDQFPIEKFRVERRLDKNYYYEMEYVSDLSYVFIEKDKNQTEGAPEEKTKKTSFQEKKSFWNEKAMQEQLDFKKKKVTDFISGHENGVGAKRTRLMVVDKQMTILEHASKPLDEFSYSIRTYRSIHNKKGLINRIRPGILCYQCPPKSEGELGDIMAEIDALEDLKPFVVVFQASWSSEHLQKHYNYDRIIAWSEPFSFNQLLLFCESYEQNLGRKKTHDQNVSYHNKEKRYYIKKDSAESFMEYPFSIKVRALCETWIKFQTDQNLALWSILKVDLPVPFNMTIIENLDEKDWLELGCRQYRAVIHGLGEKERANLRRAVNQYIHKELTHDEEVAKAQALLEKAKAEKKT